MSETSTYSTHAINSINSDNSKRLNLDVPDFQLTKYNSAEWVFMHWLTYLLFAVFFMIIPLYEIKSINKKDKPIQALKLSGIISLLISSFIEWTHYTRGCISPSNLNTVVKSNIDQSCYAKLMRMKLGLVYFTSIIGSVVLLCSCIFTDNEDHFITAAMVIFVVVSVFKIDKVVSPTKQYSCLNDLSNVFIHFLFLMGTLFIGLGSSLIWLQKMKFNDYEELHLYMKSIGGFLYLLSSLILFYRYYFNGSEDLNLNYESTFIE